MKNIINWTLGGFFRSIGRILSFIVIGGLLAFLLSKSGFKIPKWIMPMYVVKADSINYTFKQYRVQYVSLSNGETAWTSWTNFSSSTALSSGYGLQTTAIRIGSSSDFVSGNTYRITIDLGISPSSERQYIFYNSSSCYGSTSTSNWSNVEISDCQYIGLNDVKNSVHRKVIFDITPQSNFKGFQFNIGWRGTAQVSSVNVYNSTTITTGPDITGAIDEQTIIIQEEFENITNIITENNQYLIDSITESNQEVIDSQKVCKVINFNNQMNIGNDNSRLSSTGVITNGNSYFITEYIRLNSDSKLKVSYQTTLYSCFYDKDFTLIGSCFSTTSSQVGTFITIPQNAVYFRSSLAKSGTARDYYILETCDNGNQTINDFLTDDNTTSESNSLADYINNFSLSIEGPLSAIITLPINMLQNLIVDYNDNTTHSDLCTTFRGQQICLPSGDILWKRTGCHDNSPFGCPNYSAFKTFFQMLCGGFIYWQLLKRLVKTAEKGLDPSESGVNLMRL